MAIKETEFGPKNYLTWRKLISTDQIADKEMYDSSGKILGDYLKRNNLTPVGPWSVLYFKWDEKNKKTEIGIAFPIPNDHKVEDGELSLVKVPKSKAFMDILKGSYDGLGKIHESLMKYAEVKKYEKGNLPVLAIEEYVTDPSKEKDQSKLVTNIYYLYN